LHPDRNYRNVEETTKQFAEVQSAYEVLVDPQERAWYDTHRNAILGREGDVSVDHYEHNVRITTAQDITRMFTRFHGRPDFSNSSTGFYSGLRTTFDTLAREEKLACEWEGLDPVEYPSFGHADDKYDDTIKPFYAIWNGFATRKTFPWEDVYRYSEAPDRRVRRMMEKENKRLREQGIREFNDAVRSLVDFVKKRDPRFKANMQTEAERQQNLRDAAVAQAARSRAINKARNAPKSEAVPEWMQSSEVHEEFRFDEEEEPAREQFECVVCKKDFKSENQYEAHEKSRKHVRAVQHIRRQMQQEEKSLNLDKVGQQNAAEAARSAVEEPDDVNIYLASDAAYDETKATEYRNREPSAAEETSDFIEEDGVTQSNGSVLALDQESSASSSEDEYTTREKVETRLSGRQEGEDSVSPGSHGFQADINDISVRLASEPLDGQHESGSQPKVGKAKEKRAKKAAQKSSVNTGPEKEYECALCQAGFSSKSRLFNHINDLGHAAPVSKPTKASKGKKR